MVAAERKGVQVDYCPRCLGVWLDRGEIDELIENTTAELRVPTVPVWRWEEHERERRAHEARWRKQYYGAHPGGLVIGNLLDYS